MPTIRIVSFDSGIALPARQHDSDAGYDLVAATAVTLAPGERAVVGTGVGIELPEGHAGFVLPRSGLAARNGVTVLNAPGLVDSGYRGEIKVVLINHDPSESFTVNRGDRIAQLVVQRVAHVKWLVVEALSDSDRGSGGHGSTGV